MLALLDAHSNITNMTLKMKINGVFEIENEIDPQKDYSIALERIALKYTNIKEEGEDKTKTFVMENLGIATLISAEGVIKAKPSKFTQSQQLRLIIEDRYERERPNIDKEQFYTQEMSKIINEQKNK